MGLRPKKIEVHPSDLTHEKTTHKYLKYNFDSVHGLKKKTNKTKSKAYRPCQTLADICLQIMRPVKFS